MTQLSTPTVASPVSSPHPGSAQTANSIQDLAPQAVYNGGYTNANVIRLRIANGGAGQSGLIGAWANAFIKYSVAHGSDPFLVGWYLGDTTQSLAYLSAGLVDVAVTYNDAAELQSLNTGAAVIREAVFNDHFLLVGPQFNPAKLSSDNDDILDMMNKIVTTGNRDVAVPPDPSKRAPTRFLSRFDKSATNIKESELFIKIGQVPWAYSYSTWYHQYPRFPIQALEAASKLAEYTLTDRGTWLSVNSSFTEELKIYKAGNDHPQNLLLNAAHALLSSTLYREHRKICEQFMKWVVCADGGQKVIREFRKNGQVLYTPAAGDGIDYADFWRSIGVSPAQYK